jgi:hypothetical protein
LVVVTLVVVARLVVARVLRLVARVVEEGERQLSQVAPDESVPSAAALERNSQVAGLAMLWARAERLWVWVWVWARVRARVRVRVR